MDHFFTPVSGSVSHACRQQERIPLPRALLQDSNAALLRYVADAVEYAEQIGRWLRKRTERIVSFYLAPELDQASGRKPDPREVRKLTDSIDPGRAYWPRLEEPFHRFLVDLGSGMPSEAR